MIMGVLVFLLFSLFVTLLWRAVCHQIREAHLREQLLAQHEKVALARKEAIEVVAHDLKSPIATLYMNMQMAKEDLESGQLSIRQISDGLAMSLRSVKTMNTLVTQLLDHTKIEAGSLTLDRSWVDVRKLVEDHLDQVRLMAKAREVQVICQIDAEWPLMYVDEIRLVQVISNLTSNALKFVEAKGIIAMKVLFENGNFVFSIHNSGPTLTSEDLTHLFERYWQVRKTAQQGTGLGLAIVKGIVDAHGGTIEASLGNPTGLIFKITLPLNESSWAEPEPGLRPEASQIGYF